MSAQSTWRMFKYFNMLLAKGIDPSIIQESGLAFAVIDSAKEGFGKNWEEVAAEFRLHSQEGLSGSINKEKNIGMR